MKITKVDVTRLDVPLRERVWKYMGAIDWANFYGWGVVDLFRIETDVGVKGYGEMLPYYTWSAAGRENVNRVVGKNPLKLLWDDSLGAGLQMAIFDVAGKALELPCYRLLGMKVRDRCPVSWWVPDMSGEDWAEEAKEAVRSGYTSLKVKARPWYDVIEQVQRVNEVVPPNFKIDLDFNDLLLNAAYAIPILQELQTLPNVAIFETPIPQTDVPGYKQIRSKILRPIAVHYGNPPAATVLHEDVTDAYVIGGGASSVIRAASVAEETRKPFWLQMVGTGITGAFTLHFGAVLSHANLPAITCMEMYQDDLIKRNLDAQGGYIKVPEEPGLGVEIDEDAIDRLTVDPDYEKPEPTVKLCFIRADGSRKCYNHALDLYKNFTNGNQPLCEKGARLEIC